MKIYKVYGFETDSRLEGTASPELIAKSEAEETGAVPAYLDGTGVWQYVQPSLSFLCPRADTQTVYVVDFEVSE
jgi:hypothetical protein